MDIKSVLDERVIDLNMTAKNKKEAIEHLAGKENHKDRQELDIM